MRKDSVVLSIFKGVLVLSIIALVCTVLLGMVNILTQIDPLQTAYDKFAKFSDGKTYDKMIVNTAWQGTDAKVLYYAQSTDGTTNAFLAQGNGGYGGPVEVYVIIKVQEKTIEKVELGEHSETFIPNLIKANFFQKFIGKDITAFQTGTVATVLGATLSSTAILRAVYAVADYYAENPTLVTDQTKNVNSSARGADTSKNLSLNRQIENTDGIIMQKIVDSLVDRKDMQKCNMAMYDNVQDIGEKGVVKAIVQGQLLEGHQLKNKGGVI